MTTQALPTKTKIEELESIRGLAALLVVFYHIPKWNPILNIGIINNAYLMVELFFVLSGFVIFNAYADKIGTRKDLVRFQFLRFGRLYPVHLVFLFLYLALEVAKYIAISRLGTADIRSIPFVDNSFSALAEQLFLLQAIGPTGNDTTFNSPAWSISVEFYTYLIFGLTILFFKQLKIYIFLIITLISLLMLATRTMFGFGGLLRCLAGFFIGCLTASFINKTKIKLPNYLSAICFILIILFLQLKTSGDFDIAIYFLTSALIMSLVLSQSGLLRKVLQHKILTWLGLISYSVYMSHFFVLDVAKNVLKRLLNRPEIEIADGQWVLSLTAVEALATTLAFVLVVILASQITYSMIEKPMREKSRRFAFSKLSSSQMNNRIYNTTL